MKLYLLLGLLVLQLTSLAQSSDIMVKGELVAVRDWGSRSIMMGKGFFEETQDSIIAQVGEKEFEILKDKCTVAGWPEGFYFSNLSEEEDIAFDASLNKLKMYKIASYTHIYNHKIFDRYVILRIPYEENKAWNKSIAWVGNIYFIIKEKDLVP